MASAKAESASHPSQQSKNSDEEVRLATPPRPGQSQIFFLRRSLSFSFFPYARLIEKSIEIFTNFFAIKNTGSIAEREHKKWENAPPIENNPYSRENIQKRLWERQYSRRSSENSG